MIYLNNNRQTQSVYIPKRGADGWQVVGLDIICRMAFRSTVDNTTFSVNAREESPSGKYYLVTLTLPEGVQAGEYEYALYPVRLGQTPEQMAKGVCMIWPEENGPVGVEYQEHGDEPTFKQYDNE